MSLSAGSRLGPYEIVAAIGAGGMGEVYRARDTKLGRDVAIKVLPDNFSRDGERLARFQREAKLLASLNHPNIATIHGLEDSGDTHALVMELAPGTTLADRIRQGAIPVDEAPPIARQIADAMEYAHERGVVHRDLKPANIKILPDDSVKILDFGLAKAVQGEAEAADAGNSPTISQMATETGVLMGTAAYMSPEQAKGKPVDRRADIWAFGCVLYEMLTGKKAFGGETTSEVLAAVIRAEPDWSLLPPATPMRMRVLLQRCLQKDPKQRLRDIGDARISLDEVLTGVAEGASPILAGPTPFRLLTWALAIFIAGALLAGAAVWISKPSPPRLVTRAVIDLPPGEQLGDLDRGPSIVLSPDGTYLAYVARQGGTQQLYLRAMDSLEAKPVSDTQGAEDPFFSPDGQWVGFFAEGKLKKVSVSGGSAIALADAPFPGGASWGSQGMIAFAPSATSALAQVSDVGGGTQPVTRLGRAEAGHRWPDFLPGGKVVLFAAGPTAINWRDSQVAVQVIGMGEERHLIQAGTNPRFAPPGYLVYAQGAMLMGVPFDPRRLEVTGAPVRLVEDLLQSPRNGAAQYSISNAGSLAYVSGTVHAARQKLVWVGRNGEEQLLAAPEHSYLAPRLSPDGRRVAVTVTEQDSQVWTYDLSQETLTRVTFAGDPDASPIWTPDGKSIAFASGTRGKQVNIFWQLADGSGGLERLTTSEYAQVPFSWSPDGQLLAFIETNPTTGVDILVLRLRDRKVQPLLKTPFNESVPQFSPDGHWLAYISDESGRFEVYVEPYPGTGGKWQVSTEGGTEPMWNRNGRELFYRSGDKMISVDVTTKPSFSAGKPKVLFEGNYEPTPLTVSNYDVSSDGQRFLMLKTVEPGQAAQAQINVVLNWPSLLNK